MDAAIVVANPNSLFSLKMPTKSLFTIVDLVFNMLLAAGLNVLIGYMHQFSLNFTVDSSRLPLVWHPPILFNLKSQPSVQRGRALPFYRLAPCLSDSWEFEGERTDYTNGERSLLIRRFALPLWTNAKRGRLVTSAQRTVSFLRKTLYSASLQLGVYNVPGTS